jgi:hypothetical protein
MENVWDLLFQLMKHWVNTLHVAFIFLFSVLSTFSVHLIWIWQILHIINLPSSSCCVELIHLNLLHDYIWLSVAEITIRLVSVWREAFAWLKRMTEFYSRSDFPLYARLLTAREWAHLFLLRPSSGAHWILGFRKCQIYISTPPSVPQWGCPMTATTSDSISDNENKKSSLT